MPGTHSTVIRSTRYSYREHIVQLSGVQITVNVIIYRKNGRCGKLHRQFAIQGEIAKDGVKSMSYVEAKNITKIYYMGEVEIHAVAGVTFSINKGEFVVVVGSSGAGKTTVLNILGGMDDATDGELFVDGQDITKLKGKGLIQYRREDIGFVFQFYNLIQNLTALENVELALQVSKEPLDAREVLCEVGLEDRLNNFPSQLSGGEQQRVSIARALAKNPKLLLCDEPTGALDYQTGKAILSLLQDMCRTRKMTVIVITHNLAITPMADRIIRIKSGRVSDISVNEHPKPIEDIEW